jgi:hypothetical protein
LGCLLLLAQSASELALGLSRLLGLRRVRMGRWHAG